MFTPSIQKEGITPVDGFETRPTDFLHLQDWFHAKFSGASIFNMFSGNLRANLVFFFINGSINGYP